MSKFLSVEVGLKWLPADCSGYRIQMRHLPSPPTGITTLFENMNVQTIYCNCYEWRMVVHNCVTKSLKGKCSFILMRSVFGVCFIWRRAAHFLRSLPVCLKSRPFLLHTVFQFRIQNTSCGFLSLSRLHGNYRRILSLPHCNLAAGICFLYVQRVCFLA